MRFQKLLAESREHLRRFPSAEKQTISPLIFTNGAEWMLDRMNELDGRKRVFDSSIHYEKYGYFKYGICLIASLLIGFILGCKVILLLPLSILAFYILEIHFLFLFPLLIDKVENPILKSIQMTYEVGLFQTLITVIPIGFFMIVGLFYLQNPLRNWYLGCLSVLIWYGYEKN
jgi:hypothetical protein